MEFVNCTPHALTVEGLGTLAPSGIVPRCATVRSTPTAVLAVVDFCAVCAHVGGYCGNCSGAHWGPGVEVRVVAQTTGEVTGLPAPRRGVALIVSAMVLAALKGTREDVFAPDTGADAIRENGQIVAVLGLVQ